MTSIKIPVLFKYVEIVPFKRTNKWSLHFPLARRNGYSLFWFYARTYRDEKAFIPGAAAATLMDLIDSPVRHTRTSHADAITSECTVRLWFFPLPSIYTETFRTLYSRRLSCKYIVTTRWRKVMKQMIIEFNLKGNDGATVALATCILKHSSRQWMTCIGNLDHFALISDVQDGNLDSCLRNYQSSEINY
jgi:hypothetical protein